MVIFKYRNYKYKRLPVKPRGFASHRMEYPSYTASFPPQKGRKSAIMAVFLAQRRVKRDSAHKTILNAKAFLSYQGFRMRRLLQSVYKCQCNTAGGWEYLEEISK